MSHRRSAHLLSRLHELTLPRPERQAARSERLVERQMRRERDNQETPARRAGAVHAESYSRRSGGFSQRWRD
jgi:hypothetical protein